MSHTPLPPIPRWKVLTIAVGVLLFTTAAVVVLWWPATAGLSGAQLVTARLDALKVGLSIGVGGGGVFALYLAWRRQRSTEADLDNRERALAHQHQVAVDTKAHLERVAIASEQDALARRITDLYGKAVDQLGSDKAAVRLGGLYALERLAQDNNDARLRQTVVNVLCAYLRMPHSEPQAEDEAVRQEREVRLTAQRLLQAHLRPGPDKADPLSTFWADIDIDLSGATLTNFDLNACRVRTATFEKTMFVGPAEFGDGFHFTGEARFTGATFANGAYFKDTTFAEVAHFETSTFNGLAWVHASFTKHAWFDDTSFQSTAWFGGTSFGSDARFPGSTFSKEADFSEITFGGSAYFANTAFAASVFFDTTAFAEPIFPDETWARVDAAPEPERTWPPHWRLSDGEPVAREGFPGLWQQLIHDRSAIPKSGD